MKSLYINANATDPAAAFVLSETSPSPTAVPQFRLGDVETINLYLVDGEGGFDANSGGGGLTVKLGLGSKAAEPTGGTYTLTDGTDTTTSLAYNADASTIQTALNALNTSTGPFGDTVTVEGTFPAFKITFDSNGAQSNITVGTNSLTPASGISIAEVTAGDGSTQEVQSLYLAQSPVVYRDTWGSVTNGWQGQVNFNTYELRDFLDGGETAEIWLEVEITNGTDRVTRAQAKTVVHGEVIAEDAMIPVGTTTFISQNDAYAAFVQARPAITGLTGGGSANLDGILTASGAATVGWKCIVDVSGVAYIYELESGTDAESSPDVIRPDDYAASTNEVVWKLKTVNTNVSESQQIAASSGSPDHDITPAAAKNLHTAFITITDTGSSGATGDFDSRYSLKNTNTSDGDVIKLHFTSTLPMDETVKVYNDTTAGTLLTTFSAIDAGSGTQTYSAEYVYDGTAGEWKEVNAQWH